MLVPAEKVFVDKAEHHPQISADLDEDLKVTLSYLEMEERAAVSALDRVIEKNCSLMQEIEQDLIRLCVSKSQVHAEMNRMVNLTAF